MLNMSPSLPPVPSPQDIENLLALVQLLADPKATQARIKELSTAADEARQIIDQAEKDRASLAALRAQTERELSEARKRHRAQLGAEREAHDENCRRRTDDLVRREAAVKQLEAKAAADAAEAERLRTEMERRFSIVTAAA
jgi:SMC interacting uncharacterized protein involved in chromosome segregation